MQNMLYLFYVKITISFVVIGWVLLCLCKERKVNTEYILYQDVGDSWMNSMLKRLILSFVVVCQKNMEKTGCF